MKNLTLSHCTQLRAKDLADIPDGVMTLSLTHCPQLCVEDMEHIPESVKIVYVSNGEEWAMCSPFDRIVRLNN